jgi:hypothetical protein
VAEYHGLFDDIAANGSVEPVVDIASTDAGVANVYENIVGRLQVWYGTVFEFERVGLL